MTDLKTQNQVVCTINGTEIKARMIRLAKYASKKDYTNIDDTGNSFVTDDDYRLITISLQWDDDDDLTKNLLANVGDDVKNVTYKFGGAGEALETIPTMTIIDLHLEGQETYELELRIDLLENKFGEGTWRTIETSDGPKSYAEIQRPGALYYGAGAGLSLGDGSGLKTSYVCAWEDRILIASALLGEISGTGKAATFTMPKPYPEPNWLHAREIRITAVGKGTVSEGLAVYSYAIMNVTYRPIIYEEITYDARKWHIYPNRRPAQEAISIPPGPLQWVGPVVIKQPLVRYVGTYELVLEHNNVPDGRMTTFMTNIASAIGNMNTDIFWDAGVGTGKILTVDTSPSWTPEGNKKWRVNLHCMIREFEWDKGFHGAVLKKLLNNIYTESAFEDIYTL